MVTILLHTWGIITNHPVSITVQGIVYRRKILWQIRIGLEHSVIFGRICDVSACKSLIWPGLHLLHTCDVVLQFWRSNSYHQIWLENIIKTVCRYMHAWHLRTIVCKLQHLQLYTCTIIYGTPTCKYTQRVCRSFDWWRLSRSHKLPSKCFCKFLHTVCSCMQHVFMFLHQVFGEALLALVRLISIRYIIPRQTWVCKWMCQLIVKTARKYALN